MNRGLTSVEHNANLLLCYVQSCEYVHEAHTTLVLVNWCLQGSMSLTQGDSVRTSNAWNAVLPFVC